MAAIPPPKPKPVFNPLIPYLFVFLGVFLIVATFALEVLPYMLGWPSFPEASAKHVETLAMICLSASGVLGPANVIMSRFSDGQAK